MGVNTKKTSPSILLVINLLSPDRRYDSVYMSNFATIQIKDELLRIKGVGDILMLGQRDYSMRLWLDPEKLATRELDRLGRHQRHPEPERPGRRRDGRPATGPRGPALPAADECPGPARHGKAIRRHHSQDRRQSQATPPVAERPLQPGGVRPRRRPGRTGRPDYDQTATADGQPSTGMAVFLLPGANALDGGRRRQAADEGAERSLPPGPRIRLLYDTTPFIQRSVEEVFNTLVIAVLLVAVVVLFFLQDWKAMILPMIDVPVSLVGTFAVMAALGFSLNNLTLFGLVLAIGIVVDDAIMVLENIERLIATGLDARRPRSRPWTN